MDEKSRDSLGKILDRLDELQQQLNSVNQRLDNIENVSMADKHPQLEQKVSPTLAPSIAANLPVTPPTTHPPLRGMPTTSDAKHPEPKPPALPPMPPPPLVPTPHAAEKPPELNLPQANPPAPARPSPRQPAPRPSGESLEVRIGATWLSRIGILALALVLVLFAREHVQGPVGKVVGGYLLSLGLIIAGLFYEKKFQKWSATVLAGGLAFSYFTSYAMGFVEPMRLLDNLPAKLAILGLNLAVIFSFAQWKKSETMAGTALLLGYLTTGVVGSSTAALASCTALSILAVVFLWRNQWVISTAVAALASYGSWIYIQRVFPHEQASAPESFWFHFSFLTLIFIVYLVGTWVAAAQVTQNDSQTDSLQTPEQTAIPRRNILPLTVGLTQVNMAMYITTVIGLLFTTEVYWDRAWLFFFPMVAVFLGLSTLFARVKPVQMVYLLGAAVSLAFGIMSAASPLWLPVFLAVQALAMLIASRSRADARPWNALSAILLILSAGYALVGQHPLFTDINNYANIYVQADTAIAMPLWVCALVGGVCLAYGIVWEKGVSPRYKSETFLASISYIAAALGSVVWVQGRGSNPGAWDMVYTAGIVPIAGLVALKWRAAAPIAAVILGGLISVIVQSDAKNLTHVGSWVAGYWLVISAGFVVGWLIERAGEWSAHSVRRIYWRALYIWAQAMAIVVMGEYVHRDYMLLVLTLLVAGSVAAGWSLRSAALAKSAIGPLTILGFGALYQMVSAASHWTMLVCPPILLATAYPLGLAAWKRHTGDTKAGYAIAMQLGMLLTAGVIFIFGLGKEPYNLDQVFTAGLWSLICAAFAMAGLFTMAMYVSLASAALAGLLLWAMLLDNVTLGIRSGGNVGTTPGHLAWSLTAVAMIVLAERLLKFAPRKSGPAKSSPLAPWPGENGSRWITTWMAIGTMIMAVFCLRLVPELRMFYFTGALVAAAFVWIVLGFWFRESIYRQAGLLLLCAGIIKGLVWDVLSLKNTLYRQISWTILGVLAIGASFLYNRFRGRMETPPTDGDA